MLFLVRLLTLVFLVFAANARAGVIEVTTLNQESCWVSDGGNGVYKVASFNNSLAIEVGEHQAQDLYEKAVNGLNELNLGEIIAHESMLHCSAFGVSLVMNLEMENGNFCVWGVVNKNKVKLSSVGVSEREGFCHGFKAGEVLLQVHNREEAKKILSSSELSSVVENFEFITDDFIKVNLRKDYLVDTEKIVNEFNSGVHEQWLKSADLNYFNHPIGELMLLKF